MSDTANSRQDYRRPRNGVDLAKDSPFPDQSAKHASHAVDALVRVATGKDSREKDRDAEVAKAWASLAVRDKLDEMVAVIRISAQQVVDSNTKLDRDVQMAAQALHKDAQELKAHLKLVQDEAA